MVRSPIIKQLSPGKQFLLLFCLMLGLGLISLLLVQALGILIWGSDFVVVPISENISSLQLTYLKISQVISQSGLMLFPALIFAWLTHANVFSFFKMSYNISSVVILLSVFLIFAIGPLIGFLVELNEGVQIPWKGVEQWMQQMEEMAAVTTKVFLSTTTFGGLLINLFVIAVIPAISEELLFRGVVLRISKELFSNVHLAVLFSAIVFSAIHFQFYGFLPRMILGMFLGYLFVYSGSIWIPIVAHFINNATVVIVEWLYLRGMINVSMDEFGVTSNIFLVIFSAIISIAVLWAISKNRNRCETIKN